MTTSSTVADDSILELKAKLGDDAEIFRWQDLIPAARRAREWGDRFTTRAELYERIALERTETLKTHRADRLAATDEDAVFIRDAEAYRAEGARPKHSDRADEGMLAVAELATAIGRTIGTTRTLLARDEIPGASRNVPGVKNSPWRIPLSAPTLYLERQT